MIPQTTATKSPTNPTPELVLDQQQQKKLDAVALRLKLMQQYSEQAYARYLCHDTRPENLLTVVQVNIFNALARNSLMLGLSNAWLLCDSISPFGPGGLSTESANTPAYAPNLHPTALQTCTPHHPWIDLLPWPQVRDTILRLTEEELIDEDDLCYDIAEFDTFVSPSDKAALIVWGEPWDPRGWEASIPFLRKWFGILHGCTEILEATNYWREKRGEKKLKLPLT